MAKKKTKANNKAVAVKDDELVEGNLNSTALAGLANYDLSKLDGVDLDVTDNKELFKNDIVVPKIWLTQSMSDLRKSGQSKEGDFVDSRAEEILLSIDSEFEYLPVIPMKLFKRWQTFKLVKEKREFVSSELMVLGKNENLQYEEEVTGDKKHLAELLERGAISVGDKLVRRQVISCYVLLGEDAKKGLVKPYIVDFAATSKAAGRNLVSDIKTLNAKKIPSFMGWFKLGRFEDSNDEGEFFVRTMKFGGLLPEAMMTFLKDAYDEINSMIENNTIEIDDRDLNAEAGGKTTKKKASEKVTKQASKTDAGI